MSIMYKLVKVILKKYIFKIELFCIILRLKKLVINFYF